MILLLNKTTLPDSPCLVEKELKIRIKVMLGCSLKIAPTRNDLQLFLMTEADEKKLNKIKNRTKTDR